MLLAPTFAAGMMDIEPGLMGYTLLTFVLLFLLLRWRAWGPILKMAEAREKRLHDAIETARREREESARLLEEHKKLVADARREGAEAVRQALAAAEVARQEMLVKSRKEAEELIAQAKRQIDDQVSQARSQLTARVVDLAMDAAEKVVGEALADPARQRKLVEQYVRDFARDFSGSTAKPPLS